MYDVWSCYKILEKWIWHNTGPLKNCFQSICRWKIDMCTHKIKHALHYEISKTDANSAKVLSLSFHSAAVINMFVFRSCVQSNPVFVSFETKPKPSGLKSCGRRRNLWSPRQMRDSQQSTSLTDTPKTSPAASRRPPPTPPNTHTESASALTPTSSPHDLWLATWQLVHRFSLFFFSTPKTTAHPVSALACLHSTSQAALKDLPQECRLVFLT